MDPDPDPNRAKILDPDPNSMYLDPNRILKFATIFKYYNKMAFICVNADPYSEYVLIWIHKCLLKMNPIWIRIHNTAC